MPKSRWNFDDLVSILENGKMKRKWTMKSDVAKKKEKLRVERNGGDRRWKWNENRIAGSLHSRDNIDVSKKKKTCFASEKAITHRLTIEIVMNREGKRRSGEQQNDGQNGTVRAKIREKRENVDGHQSSPVQRDHVTFLPVSAGFPASGCNHRNTGVSSGAMRTAIAIHRPSALRTVSRVWTSKISGANKLKNKSERNENVCSFPLHFGTWRRRNKEKLTFFHLIASFSWCLCRILI